MSEMVLVLPVIALTAAVLIGLLMISRKWLKLRERYLSEYGAAATPSDPMARRPAVEDGSLRAVKRNAVPERRREPYKAAA